MSRASDAANAVVSSVEQVLDLYGVQHTREQSRVIQVQDSRRQSGYRPMYFGKWIDDFGNVHASGRADLLARPRIFAYYSETHNDEVYLSTPLWIECKAGKGRLSPDQEAFRDWVKSNDDSYILIHDDVRPLMEWLDAHGVKRAPKRIIAETPMSAVDLEKLDCRHCHFKKSEHLGKIAACPSGKAREIGKVWSPCLTPTKR